MNREQWERQERNHTVRGVILSIITLILGFGCLSMNKWVFAAFTVSCVFTAINLMSEGKECSN